MQKLNALKALKDPSHGGTNCRSVELIRDGLLSKDRVELQEDRKHMKAVSNPGRAETVFRSPQLTLFDLGPDEWILYWKGQPYAYRSRKRLVSGVIQPALFELPEQKKAAGAETWSSLLRLMISPKPEDAQ